MTTPLLQATLKGAALDVAEKMRQGVELEVKQDGEVRVTVGIILLVSSRPTHKARATYRIMDAGDLYGIDIPCEGAMGAGALAARLVAAQFEGKVAVGVFAGWGIFVEQKEMLDRYEQAVRAKEDFKNLPGAKRIATVIAQVRTTTGAEWLAWNGVVDPEKRTIEWMELDQLASTLLEMMPFTPPEDEPKARA